MRAADAHDRVRRVPGTFAKVMDAVGWAHEADIPLQINTVISAANVHELESVITLVSRLGIVFWEVFFLVPVGRGVEVAGLTAAEYEQVFARLYKLSVQAPFVIKVTEALHYRRYVAQRRAEERRDGHEQPAAPSSGLQPMGRHWIDRGHGAVGLAPRRSMRARGMSSSRARAMSIPAGFCRTRRATSGTPVWQRCIESHRCFASCAPRPCCGAAAVCASSGRSAAARAPARMR